MSKNRASMNISGVMCRCHRQMSGNLSKKTQIIDRSFKSERLSGCRPSPSCIDVIMQLALRRRSLSVHDSSHSRRGFREGNGRELLQCAGPRRLASFYSRSKQYSSLNRRNCSIALREEGISNTIKTECSCRMELRMADGMTARSHSLILAFVFSLRRLKRHERAPFSNDALRRLCFLKDAPVRPGGP